MDKVVKINSHNPFKTIFNTYIMPEKFSSYAHRMTSRNHRILSSDQQSSGYHRYYNFLTKNYSNTAPFNSAIQKMSVCPCCRVGIHFVHITDLDRQKTINLGIEARRMVITADYSKDKNQIHFEILYEVAEDGEENYTIDDFIKQIDNQINYRYKKLWIWVFQDEIRGVIEW